MQNILLHSYMQHNIMPHAAVGSGETIQSYEMLSSSTSQRNWSNSSNRVDRHYNHFLNHPPLNLLKALKTFSLSTFPVPYLPFLQYPPSLLTLLCPHPSLSCPCLILVLSLSCPFNLLPLPSRNLELPEALGLVNVVFKQKQCLETLVHKN